MFIKSFRKFCSSSSGLSLLFLAALIAGSFGSQAFAQKRLTKEDRPEWTGISSKGYFVGMSRRLPEETEARREAINDAKRQIIESLGAVIESEFIDEIIETSGEVTTTDAFTQSKVKVISQSIIAVKPDQIFVEEWRDKIDGRRVNLYQVYVRIPFSEAEHRSFMQQLLTETYALGQKNFDDALALAEKGLVFLAVDQLNVAEENIAPVTEMAGLSPTDLASITILHADINSLIHRIRNGIRVSGRNGDQMAKLGADLAEPLAIEIFWQKGRDRVPIPNLKVDFALTEGAATITPFAHTDRDGRAICDVREIASAGKIGITATVHFPEGYESIGNTHEFTLFPDNRVIVKIAETNLGKPVEQSYLENALLEQLSGKGFTAVENEMFSVFTADELESTQPENIAALLQDYKTDLVLLGTITVGQTNKIQDGFFFARCRGVLRVLNVDKGIVVANFILEDKNAGHSEENAGSKAITKVSDQLIEKFFAEIGL